MKREPNHNAGVIVVIVLSVPVVIATVVIWLLV